MGKVFKALSKVDDNLTASSPPSELDDAPQKQVPPREEAPRQPTEEAIETPLRREVRKPARRPSPFNGTWDERLTQATAVNGAVAESIRTLRTRILHPFMGERPRSILVTSSAPGEGKSFICANLGIALAQGVDNYSLVVDCDLRRPSLHRLFSISNELGLSDHLKDQVPLEQLITSSGVDKLALLPAGPPPVNPSELLGSGAMIRTVDELVERYDDRLVLFDSPPLHAAAETTILAQHVDAVVLVVRYGGARREHIKTLVETLGRNRIIGVVFNAFETNILDEKIFGYYEYQKDYAYSSKE